MATIFSIFKKSQGLDEIIFKDRNKEYGSYVLRKEEDSSLNKSSLITLGIVSVFCLLMLNPGKKNHIQIVKDTTAVEAELSSTKIELPEIKLPEEPDFLKNVKHSDFLHPFVVEELTEPGKDIPINPDFTDVSNEPDPVETAGTGGDGQDPVPVEITKWVYFVPEMPRFNGGELSEFRNWVQRNIHYPTQAIELGLEGKIIAEFIIGIRGNIEEVHILKGIDKLLDDEAMKVLLSSPAWKPGLQNGDPVRVKMVIPIIFKLSM